MIDHANTVVATTMTENVATTTTRSCELQLKPAVAEAELAFGASAAAAVWFTEPSALSTCTNTFIP